MPWIKNTRYPHPPNAKYKGKWSGKTLPKKVKGQVASPSQYNPKTKMYRHGTGKRPKVQPKVVSSEFVRGNLSKRQEKGEDEYTEEEWKYITFHHLASCEIDLPDSWTLGKNDPESGCIDYKRYDIYGQKRKKPVSKKKANAEFAAGEIKYYGKNVSTKDTSMKQASPFHSSPTSGFNISKLDPHDYKNQKKKKSNGFSLGWT